MALTDKLSAIGTAIREKTGKTDLMTLDQMPAEIAAIETGGGGEEYFTDDDLIFSGKCDYLFAYDKWKPVLEKEKTRIKIVNPSRISSLLEACSGEDYSFLIIEGDGTTICPAGSLFRECFNIKKLPKIRNVLIHGNQCGEMMRSMYHFNDINQLIELFDNIYFSNSTLQSFPLAGSMYSLRNIDAVMPYIKKAFANYTAGAHYGSLCYDWSSLDEINNIPVLQGTRTYNSFTGSAFNSAARLKNLTFETNNGTAIPIQWKSQTIDLAYNDGIGTLYRFYSTGPILNYSSGITADKEVIDDATYQALKNDPDWFTRNLAYSRYNHDSAVNTINSLPDTSAYLATAGGTNTIKFKGAAGSLTDGGAINTLTEAEIAVAAAKGWTVSLV